MKRLTSLLATGALALGSAAVLTTAVPGVASADCATNIQVSNADKHGWTIPDPNATNPAATVAIDTTGLNFNSPAGVGGQATYPISVAGVALASQTAQSNYALTYSYTGESAQQTTGLSYQLTIDLNRASNPNDRTGLSDFATFVYEDVYEDGVWWSTRALVGTPNEGGNGSQYNGTLDEISAAYPDARIQAFGIRVVGNNGKPSLANVKSLTFGCNTFNFGDPIVPNVPPTASFTTVINGLTVDFTSTSTDSDGSIVETRYIFNDDSAAVYEANPSHTFPRAGTYAVEIRVRDDDGAETTAVQNVTVRQPNTVTNTPLPNTGADVMGLAAVAGIAIVGSGVGLVVSRRRRASNV